MPKFIVHTDISAKDLGPFGFTKSVPQMLAKAQLRDISFKKAFVCQLAYCYCVQERRVMCEFESPNEESVRHALTKIGLPFNAILQKEDLQPGLKPLA
jgi:hypothetical protein